MTPAHILSVNQAIAKVKHYDVIDTYDDGQLVIQTKPLSRDVFSPMTSWHDAGPLVEEAKLNVRYHFELNKWWASWPGMIINGFNNYWGLVVESEEPLHAICYAYLRSHGVEHPERLGVE